jgi:succinoglycan biosynthesis transport protein ExoP
MSINKRGNDMPSNQSEYAGGAGGKMLPELAGDTPPSNTRQKPYFGWQDVEEIQLRDYLDVILRRRWLILSVLALVILSTIIFTLAVTRIYEATAVIEVSQETPHVTSFQEIMGSEIQAREFYETQVELLGSKTLINHVIDNLALLTNPVIRKTVFGEGNSGLFQPIRNFFKSLTSDVDEKSDPSSETAEIARRQKVAKYISKNLTIRPSRKSMLIDVAFRSPDRRLSQSVVNALIEDFIHWKMKLKLDASSAAREFLMMQMDRAKINLEKAEERLNAFAKQAGIVSLDAKINSTYGQLEELNAVYAKADADMIAKKAAYEQAVSNGQANLPLVLNSELIASLKSKYADLDASYEELKTTFRDDYPKVKALKARMDSVTTLIEAQEQGILLSLENEYESAQKVVDALKKRIEQQKRLALDLNDHATHYSIMAREVDTNKAIFQSLLKRAKEIESMAGVSSSNIQIVNRADLPLQPVIPNVPLNLLLALIIGLLGAIGCAFLAEYFADTVTNPNEISDRFQIPLLGMVPQTKPDRHGLENAFLHHPLSSFSEAIRSTRVSVQLSGSGARSKCFLVTSTLPSEGKTTLAVNLAMSFAAAGEKTVIIDADLRKPRLHEVFDLTPRVNGNGVSSFLADVTDQIKVHNGQIKQLGIIPSGPVPPNPAELLASRRFKLLLRRLANRYDRIILDGPPHIGFADTLILSKTVGGIVLVSSIGESSRDSIAQFKKSITNVNGTILGCIVNKVDFNRKYGYGGYYKAYQSYAACGKENEGNALLNDKSQVPNAN